MGKRGSEYQLTKDDFEATGGDEKAVESNQSKTFARATPEELARRRLVRGVKK